jgi:hypothetical protein
LRDAVADWQKRMRGAGEHDRIRLLESFITSCPESARATSPQVSPGLARKFKEEKVKIYGKQNRNGSSLSRSRQLR